MKTFFKIFFIVLALTFIYETIISYQTGIGGHTRKNLGTLGDGCICHRADSSSVVVVRITGPAAVLPNSVNIYRITMRGGPAITGGFDFNVKYGNVDTVQGEETRKIVEIFDSINDIAQSWPKHFVSDSVSWLVKYIAPNSAVITYDTLYATGNSTNNDGVPNDSDKWNFSPNFVVQVNPSIGIQQISSVADKFTLGQNYPNPFNPSTNIRFEISDVNYVNLKIYDITGREAAVLVNNLLQRGKYEVSWNASAFASGVYYYRLTAGKLSSVKKMILVK